MMALGVPVVASGGVSGVDDIVALAQVSPEAVIVGRALYEGRLTVSEAIAAASR
jgi:phosphoribosylformimino-5-aminoimidazole carboxamide ribotide isomerase